MRSEIHPETRRLTMPRPSISDSISAPRAAPKPRSPQYATIWTCGIDIATQHDTPATHSSACRCPGAGPSAASEPWTTPLAAACSAACSGGRRRSTSASGTIDAMQNTPMPI